MAPTEISIGILMIPYQTIDVAMPLDILSSCSTYLFEMGAKAGSLEYASLIPKTLSMKYHHINSTMSPVTLTGGFSVLPSTTIENCPELDYLLVGGPDMTSFTLSPEFSEFVKKHVESGKGLFTTCTGAFAIASSGVLDGKRATTNHEALEMARKAYPDVKWVTERWVQEGNLWTAGGACAGMDMMGHWVIDKVGVDVARIGFRGLDFVMRGLDGELVVL